MHRRTCLKAIGGSVAALQAAGKTEAHNLPFLTPPDEIERAMAGRLPLNGGPIPVDLASRLGATHYGGRYFLTKDPFLLEGARAIERIGMKAIKLWLSPTLHTGYGFNSEWNLPKNPTLVEIVKHRYYREALAMPFSTFAFEVAKVSREPFRKNAQFDKDGEQIEELAVHLLRTHKHRDVTFILQHWEGDWMLRGRGVPWKKDQVPEDAGERIDAMVRWLSARQNGVDRARAAERNSRCKVYHVTEVNRIYDALQGIPTVISHVVPQVKVDGVSWSSYDGMGSTVKVWQGLDIIAYYAGKKPFVMIGEVGRGETGRNPQELREWWNTALGVFFARNIPWIFQWEVYCNEIRKGMTASPPVFDPEQLNGFWLVRPDGQPGVVAQIFEQLLRSAGKSADAAIQLFTPAG